MTMKIIVLSDIHANLEALKVVLARVEEIAPDVVVVGGDVVNRGSQPAEVLELILDKINNHGWLILKGNHEDYVTLASKGIDHLPDWEREVYAHTSWTARAIPQFLPVISNWPDSVEVKAPDGSHLTCFHASKKGNRVGLYTTMKDDELRDHTHGVSSAICVGHTHVPFIRTVHGTLLVNSGAVGMPFDGVPDASIALFEWSRTGWTAEIIRIPYDRNLTRKAFDDTGYIHEGGKMVQMIVRELETARPLLGSWHRRFEKEVSAGKIGLQESIDQMLAGL